MNYKIIIIRNKSIFKWLKLMNIARTTEARNLSSHDAQNKNVRLVLNDANDITERIVGGRLVVKK